MKYSIKKYHPDDMQPDSNDFKMTKYVLNTNLRYIGNM